MTGTGSRAAEGGFTLMEVMVSLIVFLIGVLGIMALLIAARKGNNDSHSLTAATTIGEDWMETLRAESLMWNQGPADLTPTATPMLQALGGGVGTAGATTGWLPIPGNPLLARTGEERMITGSDGSLRPAGDYCVEYRLTTLIPDQVLRAEVRVMWWKESVTRPSGWETCPAPTGSGGNPDSTLQHLVSFSSTLWRNPL